MNEEALYCPQCGYDLRAIPQCRCPECGFGYNRDSVGELSWREGARSLAASRRAMFLAGVGCAAALTYLAVPCVARAGLAVVPVLALGVVTLAFALSMYASRWGAQLVAPAPLRYPASALLFLAAICGALAVCACFWPPVALCAAVVFSACGWWECLCGPTAKSFGDLNLPAALRRAVRRARTWAIALVITSIALTLFGVA